MYAHLCKGYAPQIGTFEIMLPYAGIIRIRFMGMISATVIRAPLQYVMAGLSGHLYFFSTTLTS